MLLSYIKADFIKTRHLHIRAAHLIISIITALVFIAYYSYSPWDDYTKIDAYFQVLGMGMPVLIGLFCTMIAEQEQSAGSYQNMLMVPNKQTPFWSKLLLLLGFGFIAIIIAGMIFGIGFRYMLGIDILKINEYLVLSFIIWVTCIPLYIIHMFLSMKYSKGVSIGLGIVESLISALLLTGLGDVIWRYVPASWPSRTESTYLMAHYKDTTIKNELASVSIIYIVVTVALLLLYSLWINRWEGTKTAE